MISRWMTWFRMFKFDDELCFSDGASLPPRNAIIQPEYAAALSGNDPPGFMS